jgi:hypothetical protein
LRLVRQQLREGERGEFHDASLVSVDQDVNSFLGIDRVMVAEDSAIVIRA